MSLKWPAWECDHSLANQSIVRSIDHSTLDITMTLKILTLLSISLNYNFNVLEHKYREQRLKSYYKGIKNYKKATY